MEQIFTFEECARIMEVKRKVEQHIPQILPCNRDFVIAGGCIASYFHDETPKDIDVFILGSDESTPTFISRTTRLIDQFKESNPNYLNNPTIITAVLDTTTNIQYIFSTYTSRQALLKDFDYVHCCASYYKGKMYISRAIYDAIKNKKLVVMNKANLRGCREQKYLDRGYTK